MLSGLVILCAVIPAGLEMDKAIMITRYEQIVGSLTLILLGGSVILSRFVTLSTNYFLEVNFGINQYVLGAICFFCVIPLVTKQRSRSAYFICLFPYNLYLIGNIRFSYVNHLASVVPSLLFCLWLALMFFVLRDVISYMVALRGQHGNKRPKPNAG